MSKLRKWWGDRMRGYSASDMEMLRVKIQCGLEPGEAKLSRRERNALLAMSREEIIQLACIGYDARHPAQ